MTDETTKSPVPAGGSVTTVDGKMLLVVLALMGGGGLGGGVMSAVQARDIPTTISADIKEVSGRIADLRITIERMEGASKSSAADVDRFSKRLDAVEARVRELELRQPAARPR